MERARGVKWGSVGLCVIASALCYVSVTYAAVKDTDFDGLTDTSEVSVYKTDAKLYDTDGDGIGDGQEVLDGTNPLDARSSMPASLLSKDTGFLGPAEQRPWYVARASGLLAFFLLSCGVIYGLVLSSRTFGRIIKSPTAYELHRTLSLVSLGVVCLHIGSFFFDGYIKIRSFEAFVPGVLKRSFPSALGYDLGFSVGMGIIAFYLILMLIITSEFRAKISARTWRKIHYVSFLAYILFTAHGFTAGTDSGQYWVRMMYLVSFSVVMILVCVRIVSRGIMPKWRARQGVIAQETLSSTVPPSIPPSMP